MRSRSRNNGWVDGMGRMAFAVGRWRMLDLVRFVGLCLCPVLHPLGLVEALHLSGHLLFFLLLLVLVHGLPFQVGMVDAMHLRSHLFRALPLPLLVLVRHVQIALGLVDEMFVRRHLFCSLHLFPELVFMHHVQFQLGMVDALQVWSLVLCQLLLHGMVAFLWLGRRHHLWRCDRGRNWCQCLGLWRMWSLWCVHPNHDDFDHNRHLVWRFGRTRWDRRLWKRRRFWRWLWRRRLWRRMQFVQNGQHLYRVQT